MKTFYLPVCIAAVMLTAQAQQTPRVEFTVVAGVPLTPTVVTGDAVNPAINPYFDKCGECATFRTAPYLGAATISIRLASRYRLAAGALYAHASYTHTSATFSASGTSILQDIKATVDHWQFPLYIRRELPSLGAFTPYAGVGANTQYTRSRVTQGLNGSHSLFFGTFINATDTLTAVRPRFTAGPMAVAGLHVGRRRLRPVVELRYTRWVRDAIAEGPFRTPANEDNPATLRSNPNQLHILVGLTF